MLTHYLLIASRNIGRHRFNTIVSVTGLALGLACLIGARLFVSYVESADSHFPSSERIFAVYQASSWNVIGLEIPISAGATPLIAERLRIDYPQIEVARSRTRSRSIVTVDGERSFERVRYVDPEFLGIFTLTFTSGSPPDFESSVRSVILTESAALSLFGTTDVVGRAMRVEPVGDVEVAAIIAPIPEPSHFAGMVGDEAAGIVVVSQIDEDVTGGSLFDPDAPNAPPPEMLESMSWLGFGGTVETYLLLPEDGRLTPADLNAAFRGIVARHAAIQDGWTRFEVRHVSQLLRDGLNEDALGPFSGVSLTDLLQALGALILAVACLNFVNLATARAAVRGKEIGLRKTLGARRGQLVAQHLSESTLVAVASVCLALVIVQAAVAGLNRSAEMNLPSLGEGGGTFWLFVAALTLAVGAAGGLYPALVLARVEPIAAIRAGSIRVGSSVLRTALIGFQFAAASFLLIVVTVVAAQNRELARKGPRLGADPIVVITTNLGEAGIDPEQFRTRLEASPHVMAVTGADVAPWERQAGGTGYSRVPDDMGSFEFTQEQRVSYGYFETLGTQLLAGRTFDPEHGDADVSSEPRIVIDRLTAEQFGWSDPQDAVGEALYTANLSSGPAIARTIIGVVDHEPARVYGWGSRAFVYRADESGITYPILRISRQDVPSALAHIDATWQAFSPEMPISREFVDERFERAYALFRRVITAFAILAGIAFAIAVTGLLGMVLFVVARRRHEMGVRKVLGASSPQITRLLIWQFVRPVLIANIAVWPLAFIAARLYTDMFMYPISLTAWPFLLSLVVTLLVAAVVVGRQAVSSARTKPAAILRYE